jgi:hypothetical protein
MSARLRKVVAPTATHSESSLSSRIEPITPSGQVYSSQSFAALATARGVREFRRDYVGQTSLAKAEGA